MYQVKQTNGKNIKIFCLEVAAVYEKILSLKAVTLTLQEKEDMVVETVDPSRCFTLLLGPRANL